MGCSFSSPFDGGGTRTSGSRKADHSGQEPAKGRRGWNWDSAASANNHDGAYQNDK